ncbi:hypothetical protein GR01_08875 [Mycobacteroides chelonae]|nr:hypothetical protein GR01_08875 [Mycobacteroides chelonae]
MFPPTVDFCLDPAFGRQGKCTFAHQNFLVISRNAKRRYGHHGCRQRRRRVQMRNWRTGVWPVAPRARQATEAADRRRGQRSSAGWKPRVWEGSSTRPKQFVSIPGSP